jgi:LacI family transcriptional regulator
MRPSTITIKDIAKLLGVSKSTVSRALKDHPDISEETKQAVRSIAESFHYRPSQLALSLRYKQSKLIGLIIPQIYNFFFPSVIKGIEEIVRKQGYNLIILQSNESFETEVDNVDFLLANNVEGILACVSRETSDFDHFQYVINSKIPIVFFDRVPKDLNADMVLLDDISGAYQATHHLIQRGRKNIAICVGKPDLLISTNRLEGYKHALSDNNLIFKDEYVISGQSSEEVKLKMLDIMELNNPPDGIFAISDLTLVGVMQALYEKDIKIPEQISVIGFSEVPFSTMYKPPVSSIRPMGNEIGRKAAEIILERIKSPCETRTKSVNYIPGDLIVRGST